MKKIFSSIIVSALILLCQSAYAQEDEPRFPGCDDPADVDCADMKMMQFVFSNLKHPDGNPGGEVVASFMVKASGELTDVSIVESLSPACDEEVTRIVNLMPNWLPAKVEGAETDMEWELVVKFIAK
ncbi:energy transducer TonB [Aureispira anguillae]|uniref:Energy transducer TonB n=1 Tax=Aureispira anguillae TaxID=2864201 RepID=A0A915YIJ5_9BACT|nr:energy transducer TonB [Aureispira anguillae]BDS13843.1 energy transducer TonB [Aureispira anguillae]